jgi:pimeloyl-ACP methyl ester carboxylesterase
VAFHEIVGDRTEAEPKVYESPLLGVYVSMQNWIDAGPVLVDRLRLSNYTKESKFDEFVKTLKWEGRVENIRSQYLVVAGATDELSPLEHTERMFRAMTGPRQLVVYADSRHSVGNVPAANLGPFPSTLLVARLGSKPFNSERWFIEATGRVVKAAL